MGPITPRVGIRVQFKFVFMNYQQFSLDDSGFWEIYVDMYIPNDGCIDIQLGRAEDKQNQVLCDHISNIVGRPKKETQLSPTTTNCCNLTRLVNDRFHLKFTKFTDNNQFEVEEKSSLGTYLESGLQVNKPSFNMKINEPICLGGAFGVEGTVILKILKIK